jgi:hypothetical protein
MTEIAAHRAAYREGRRQRAPFVRLRLANGIMALLHLVQGVLILALSTSFSLPVTSAFLQLDPGTEKLEPVADTLFDVRIGPLVAAFFLLSAAAHLLVAAPRLHRWYERNLARGVNPARWLEYSLSASLMIVVISMLVGIYDVGSLLLVFALNASMILFGWLMELHNQTTERTNWTAFLFGTFAGAVPWVVIGVYLFGSGSGEGGPPTFVYAIFGSIFLVFNIFPLNMVLQYKKIGPWRDYLFGERVYVLLSLTAKSLLAWQVFAGTLRPV